MDFYQYRYRYRLRRAGGAFRDTRQCMDDKILVRMVQENNGGWRCICEMVLGNVCKYVRTWSYSTKNVS